MGEKAEEPAPGATADDAPSAAGPEQEAPAATDEPAASAAPSASPEPQPECSPEAPPRRWPSKLRAPSCNSRTFPPSLFVGVVPGTGFGELVYNQGLILKIFFLILHFFLKQQILFSFKAPFPTDPISNHCYHHSDRPRTV